MASANCDGIATRAIVMCETERPLPVRPVGSRFRHPNPEENKMTAYELIQRLAKFPPSTRVVHAIDWSTDVVLADYTDVTDGPPSLALSNSISTEPGAKDRVDG